MRYRDLSNVALVGVILFGLVAAGFSIWLDNRIGNECVAAGHSWWFCRHFGFFWWMFS